MIEDTEYEPSEAIYFGDPPSLPRSATKGLPPARTRFAAYIAWRNKIVDEISGLEKGKTELEARISRANDAKAETQKRVETAAGSLLGRIKAGLGFDLSQVELEGRQATQQLDESSGHLTVARATLAQIEPEIAARRADLAALESRWNEFAGAALDEYAKGLYADYNETLRQLKTQITQLEGLGLAGGRVRPGGLEIILPGYHGCGHTHKNLFPVPSRPQIEAAAAQWRSLAKAWEVEPRVDAGKILKFESVKGNF
jgi:multidrug efflux pump subunit AcrA (membrane-fusion protein)